MSRFLIIVSFLLIYGNAGAQSGKQKKSDADEIKQIMMVLNNQAKAWSEGNLEKFMEGYWKSDSLMFLGSRGITYGWEKTLANYKKGYPDRSHTGKLDFEVLHLEKVGKDAYFMMGKFMLTREVGDTSGFFSLLWKKIHGEWKVVIDHT
ncbi:MAG: nuclear transport factor 2 family protein [Flammeovirgaceae bacterium]|nr:nuclear transport factor 2 family protein [Flammeovirgaceae bacterium]